MNIDRMVKKNIRRLIPYQAEKIRCRVKLDANESPFGFDNALKAVDVISTNRYPDPEAKALRKILARQWSVNIDNVLHGNGSDELIYYLITVFGGPVMFPTPTFSMYGIIAQVLDEELHAVPLDRNLGLDEKGMVKAIREKKPGIVFLSSPNNPTGNCFQRGALLRIISQCKGIVVIDEAYQPFSSEKSFANLINDHPNLVVMRTLSKIGLAALRSGFIVAQRDIIHEVNKVRLPFNVNSLSQEVAVAALREKKFLNETIRTIVKERKRVYKEMMSLPGIDPYPSDANFILFKVKDAGRVYNGLLKKGVLVRNMTGAIKGCLRVTIGTPAENTIFIRQLTKTLASP